ncbi:L-sorbose 1-dehydrogenase [Colletotrichum tropicale]|nr:L-sorbose 1-dehydrogenase [Colletotrichum tropicale]
MLVNTPNPGETKNKAMAIPSHFLPLRDLCCEKHVVADVAGKSCDYIIVGGGTAACVIASRLSEDPNVSVLVISKGKVKDDWLNSMPIVGNARENYGSDIDTIPSEPDEQWSGVPVRYFASQALGGASIHNGLQYTRGPPANYNHWATLGNNQWSFEKCEPYFKKLENASSQPRAPYRGHNGPIHIRQDPSLNSVDKYIEEAAKDMNLPVRNDINNPNAPPEALFEIEHMITKTGHRNSAQVGYLPKSLVLERQETLTI